VTPKLQQQVEQVKSRIAASACGFSKL